jgi:Ca2+-binding RTX toxin-like protein
VPGLAQAGSPSADTWFEVGHDFSGDTCVVASLSVCKLSLDGLTMDCQTEKATDYEAERLGAKAYLVRNESDLYGTDICDGYEYCLFGALKTNDGTSTEETFYCKFDGDDIETILLRGTDEQDELFFHHAQNDREFDLEGHSGASLVTGVSLGQAQGDQIHGSRSNDGGYKDLLRGDEDDDLIDSHAGNDEVHDGLGDDVIMTGPGNDMVYLTAGTNQVSTEDGDDTVYGGTDADHVHLGDGNDRAYLGTGQDVACGGKGEDDLQGQAHDDKLWGGDQDDDVDGAGEVTADYCSPLDGGGTRVNCESELTEEPPECPDEHPAGWDG